MSFGTASSENAISKSFHSLTLIAGLEAAKNNKTRPVDLNVRGGGIFNKNLIVCGNVDVEGFICGNYSGNIVTDEIVSSNLTQGITVIGNLIIDDEFSICANVVKANTIISNNGDDITIQSTNEIILNTTNVIVTGNLEADRLCGNIVQTDKIIPKTGNAVCISGNINVDNGNVLCANNFQTNKIVPKTGNTVCITGNLDVIGALTFLSSPSLIVNEVAIVSQNHLNQITPTNSVSTMVIQAQPWITAGIAVPGQQWNITEDGFYIIQIVSDSTLATTYGFNGPRVYSLGGFPDTTGFQGSFIRSGSDYIIGGQASYTAAGGESTITLTITKVLN